MATMKEERSATAMLNHQVHDGEILCVSPVDRERHTSDTSYHQATSSSTPSPVDQPRTLWTSEDDGVLKDVLAESIKLHPIPWQRISQALPWKPPHEVLERASKCLEDLQRELSAHISTSAAERRAASSRADAASLRVKMKSRVRWTEEEHKGFLRGIETYGWGNWKTIGEMYIPTRTVSQITSHAQKYQIHKSSNRPGKRRSIHDITLAAAAANQPS